MTVAVENRMLSWPQHSSHASYYYPTAHSPYNVIPPKNTKELTRDTLTVVLEYLSSLLESEFKGLPIRLVAHGGACMLLHPGLHDLAKRKSLYHSSRGESVPMRKTTRDVDYIRRSFIAEYVGKHKILDADYKLQKCIRATAVKFGLGADWMNADADVALPMSTTSSGMPYDPIYHASLQPFNIRLYTVFTSKNQKLTIVNVTPAWAVALKLVRYAKWDPGDISLLLMNGTNLSKVHWTTRIIKKWLTDECPAMAYHNWEATRLMDMTSKIDHAVQMITSIGTNLPPPARDLSTPSGLAVAAAAPPVQSGGLTSTSTSTHNNNSARQSPTSGAALPAPTSFFESSSTSLLPGTQHLALSSSHSRRPLGPSGSLDSSFHSWSVSSRSSGNALALTLDDDGGGHSPPSLSREKKKKKRKSGHHESRKSFSGGSDMMMIPMGAVWHDVPVPPKVDHHPPEWNMSMRAVGEALPSVSGSPPFIPDFPGDLASWRRSLKEKQRSDKHIERRKEKQKRDRERDFSRRFKHQGRGSLLDDPRDFRYFGEEGYTSEPEGEVFSSDEEDDRPLEYTPMPPPPPEVYTREWQENRNKQEEQWREQYKTEPSQGTTIPILPDNNRPAVIEDVSEPSTNPHWRQPQHSQTWPGPTMPNSELMMAIYSTPRESPASTQATSPPSLNPDPSAPTHVHVQRRSFTSPVGH